MTNENQRHKNVKKRTKAYRKLVINYNIIATVLIVVAVLFTVSHIFTFKKHYRDKGLKYYNKGQYEKAIDYFDKCLKTNQWFSDNVDADVLMYEASAYLNIEQYENAKACYQKLLKKYSDDYYNKEEIMFFIRLCDGLVKYRDGKYQEALDVLAESCDRGYLEFALYTANCYEQIGRYDYMKVYLDAYARVRPMNAFMYYKYAVCSIRIGDYQGAIQNIAAGMTLNDSEYQQSLKYLLIMCYAKTNDYQMAYNICSEYMIEYPDDIKGQKLLIFLETRGNPDSELVNDIFGVNGLNN